MSSLNRLLFTLLISAGTISGFSQAQQNIDLAINHNRLLRERTVEGAYKLIGTYKVIGTSYLFGERNKGDLYAKDAKAFNIHLNYNTYNQEVEFFSSSNPEKPLIKLPGEVDSFSFQSNPAIGITAPIKFVYGGLLGSTEKAYFMEVYKGARFSIYKRYKSELDYVSSNYVQSELRQFEMTREYYYADTEKKVFKKIKPNSSNVIKEFKDIKDVSGIVEPDAYTTNPDAAFIKLFTFLNN
ncbi:MAG: hypothetical protein NTW29_14770 [Bacteroidetes bacterium]|nr:hypothetical protein [Bacteroidota bacterium]